jgi:drug/metabolite transporter (DMT)-like permease
MNARKGIVLKIVAALFTVVMGACVSGLKGEIPIGEVVFFRSAGAFLPLFLWMLLYRNLRQELATRHIGGHIIRSASGTGGMFLNYMALIYLPLVDATALSYAAPLFTVVLAATLLGEVVRGYRWTAVGVGLLGVLVMLSPHASWGEIGNVAHSGQLVGALLGLAGAFCAAISIIQIRHLGKTESPGAIVLYFSLITTLIGLSTIGFGWKIPTLWQLMLLLGTGLSGGLAQLLITLSLRHAAASLLAPFEYSTMIWALLVGYVFMGQIPVLTTVAGAALVIAAGLFTIWRENRLKKADALSAAVVVAASESQAV